MEFLYVILGILAFFALILMLRASLTVEYGEELKLYVSVLGIRYYFVPKKKKKYRLSHYTEKKVQKRLEKEEKKKAKKALEKGTAETAPAEEGEKAGILDKLDIILDIVKVVLGRFSKHIRIKLTRLNINIATGDAAATAMLYGTVAQAVAYLIEILDCYTTNLKTSDININADFLGEKTTADIKITFKIRVWQVLDIGVRGLFGFLKYKNM